MPEAAASRAGRGVHRRPSHARHKRFHRVKIIALWIAGAFLVWLLILVISARPATYSVSAITEAASVVVNDRSGVRAWLPDASVSNPASAETANRFPHRVRLDIDNGATIKLARQRDGDLLIQVNWAAGQEHGAQLIDPLAPIDDQTRFLKTGDVIRVLLGEDSGTSAPPHTVLLSFRGDLQLGNDVGPQVERTLLSGTVTIVEGGLWKTGGRYVLTDASLDPGDEVIWRLRHSWFWHWRRPNESVVPVVSGFVYVGSEEAMRVVGHAAADYVEVARFGGASYQIRPRAVERAIHNPLISALISITTCIAAVTALLSGLEWLLNVLEGEEDGRGHT